MVKTNEIRGAVTKQEFESAFKKTRVKQKGRKIAYDVLVLGLDPNEVAATNEMSYQRVRNICERVYREVNNDKMVECSVRIPVEIAPLVQQILTTIETIYKQGKKENKDHEDISDF